MPIYMAQLEGYTHVKIGVTRNVVARMQAHQSSHFLVLSLIHVLDGDKAQELALHARFSHLRLRAEWFRYDPAMLGDLGLLDLPVPVLPRSRIPGQPYGPHAKPYVKLSVRIAAARQAAPQAAI